MIVGTCFSEFAGAPNMLDKNKMTDEEKLDMLKARFGDAAEGLLDLFKKAYPHLNTAYAGCTDTFFRKDTMDYVLKKAAESEAPVYNYVFALPYTFNGGTPAMHGADIAYGLHNIDKVPAAHVPGDSEFLNVAFSNMYAAFAKTGNPNTPDFPEWTPCTGEHINTMIFDSVTELREDHDKELVPYIMENTPKYTIDFHPVRHGGETWKY